MGIKSLIEKITKKHVKGDQTENFEQVEEVETGKSVEIPVTKEEVEKIDQRDMEEFLRLTNPDLGESYTEEKEKHFEYIEYGASE